MWMTRRKPDPPPSGEESGLLPLAIAVGGHHSTAFLQDMRLLAPFKSCSGIAR